MSNDADFDDITAGKPDVSYDNRGLATIKWPLDRPPDRQWTDILIHPGQDQEGRMPSIVARPEVTGRRVQITVQDADLETAARWVEALIREANEKYRQSVLPRRQQEAGQARQEQGAAQSRLQAARDRLSGLDERG